MRIIAVKYIKDYQLELTFSNTKVNVVDLSEFVTKSKQPMTSKYKDLKLFKKARIENGHLTWGDNEMDLSAESLYRCKGSLKPSRISNKYIKEIEKYLELNKSNKRLILP